MSFYIGVIPFDVAPVLVMLAKWQVVSVWMIATGRYEAKRRFVEHQMLSPHEQYRRHLQNGGYRPC